jgi:hypothetical protein
MTIRKTTFREIISVKVFIFKASMRKVASSFLLARLPDGQTMKFGKK